MVRNDIGRIYSIAKLFLFITSRIHFNVAVIRRLFRLELWSRDFMIATGIRLLIYLGVAFMFLGSYTILSGVLDLSFDSYSTFGVFVCAIGITISFVGFLGKDSERSTKIPEKEMPDDEGRDAMSYQNVAARVALENTRKFRGNRAIGFVLMFIGIIIVAPLLIFPFMGSCCNWPDVVSFFVFLGTILSLPITLLGLICLTFGLMFRRLSSQ